MISTAKKAELSARDAKFVGAYRAGEPSTAIAKREGVSVGTVTRAIRMAGASLPKEEARARWIAASHSPAARLKASDTNRRPLADRFLDKVEKGANPDDCWTWTGAIDGVGYPQIYMDGRRGKASHASLALDGRPRPIGLSALHTCDNPLCVNPKHLWWGTQLENIQDAKAKGRMNLDGLALGLAARLG